MTLKRANKEVSSKDENRVSEILSEIKDLDTKIINMKQQKLMLMEELENIKLAPFKVGQTVLAEIHSGRTKKWQMCIIECENGCLYLRPFKADGSLSGRHFSLIPVGDKTYSDYLKEVK